MPCRPHPNSYGAGDNPGTETSKYPEEEKSTEIAGVAASETARAQTHARVSVRALPHGGRGSLFPGLHSRGGVTKDGRQRNGMEGPAAAGDSPVREAPPPRQEIPSRAGHVKPGPKQGGPPSKAKHSPMTDSERVP